MRLYDSKNINNTTEEKQDDNEQFVGNRKVYPCHICLRLLRTEIGLKNHMTIHNENKYTLRTVFLTASSKPLQLFFFICLFKPIAELNPL
jgi:hypothetical protein